MYSSKQLQIIFCLAFTAICQLSGNLGELEITPFPDSNCLIEATNKTNSQSTLTVYRNVSLSCDLYIDPLSSSQILISVVAGNITSTDYLYVERMGQLGVCSNRYVVFMELLQQPCRANFGSAAIQLHFRGDIAVGIQEIMVEEDRPLKCPEVNQEDMVGALEGQTSNCKQVQGFSSVIQCVRTNHQWWIRIYNDLTGQWEYDSKPTSRCDVQCPNNCSCMLSNRQVLFNCSQNIPHLVKTSSRCLLFLSDISYLNLSKNGISALTMETFMSIGKNIRYLDLSSNFLTTLPSGSLDYLCNIIYLDFNRNLLVTLDTGLFVNLHSLTVLSLYSNALVTIDVRVFANLHRMRQLDLSSNSLATLNVDVFADLHSLISLSLAYNLLVTLDVCVFANLHSLTYLILDGNSLVTLDVGVFVNLHSLTHLSLNSNKLVALAVGVFANLHNLTTLFLYDNSLVTLDAGVFANLYNLVDLIMDQNALVALEMHVFVTLHKLRYLYLTDNKLVALDHRTVYKLTELRYLYINKNKISHLEAGTFSNLFLLKILSVAFNQLTFLPFSIFEDLHSLIQLDISGNRLQTIPEIGHMTFLNKIDLFANPLAKVTKNMFSRIGNNIFIFADQPEVCICYLNGSETCFNIIKPSPYLTCDQLLSSTAFTVFIWIIGCSAILGNVFVVWWKHFKQRTKNKVHSLLLSNLAVSDLLMGIYMIIIASADVYYGEYFPMNAEHWRSSVLCRIAGTLAITSSEASVLFVTFISIDRFITIRFPFSIHKLHVRSTRLIAASVWAFSLTLGLTASILAGRNSDFYDNSHVCIGLPLVQIIHPKTQTIKAANIAIWEDYGKTIEAIDGFDQSPGLYFSVAVFIAFNMFCFLLILVCYIGLFRAVSRSSREAFRQKEMAEEIRMTLKVSAIILTDFFCWFPICLMGALVQIGLIDLPNSVYAWAVTFVLPINSAINPFLYTIAMVITDRRAWRMSDLDRIQMQTQPKRVQSTHDIPKSQSERVERQYKAPLAKSENTT